MKNLAPNIKRQRLLLEGFYEREVNESTLHSYFKNLCTSLRLKAYGDAIIHSPQGLGSEENQGYDAFLPLIDSGISIYIWSHSKFFSIIIYTCKDFDENIAKSFTEDFFKSKVFETLSF